MKQSYINLSNKEVVAFEPFEIPASERHLWLQLVGDETHLIDFKNDYHSETIITSQSVICWMWAEDDYNVYSLREYTTPTRSHAVISEELPIKLWAMVEAYLNDVTHDEMAQKNLLHAIRTNKGGKK